MATSIPSNCAWVGGVSPADLPAAPAPCRRPNFERNRKAILSSCRAAMRSGTFRPSALDVARDANVSIRTVFHHFVNHEALLAAAIEDEQTRRTILALLLRDSLFPSEMDCMRVVKAAVLGRA